MKILISHKYPLRRQTHEGHLVEDIAGDQILNQKGEWGCSLSPILTIESEAITSTKRKGRELFSHEEDKDTSHMSHEANKCRVRFKVPKNMRIEPETEVGEDRNSPRNKFAAKATLTNKSTVSESNPETPKLTMFTVLKKTGFVTVDGQIVYFCDPGPSNMSASRSSEVKSGYPDLDPTNLDHIKEILSSSTDKSSTKSKTLPLFEGY